MRRMWVIAPILALVLGGWGWSGEGCGGCGKAKAEEKVPLDKVPAVVLEAAVKALPGFKVEEATKETEKGVVIYELEGKVGDKEYEVEVTAEGKVMEIEADDADEDDDEDGDDDDDDKDDDK